MNQNSSKNVVIYVSRTCFVDDMTYADTFETIQKAVQKFSSNDKFEKNDELESQGKHCLEVLNTLV